MRWPILLFLTLPAITAIQLSRPARCDTTVVVGEDTTFAPDTPLIEVVARRLPAYDAAMPAVVDGVRLMRSGEFLKTVRAAEVESVELITPLQAALRYGVSPHATETLVVWTRGRGPHARKS
jgi:hypothetical protein